MKSYWMHIDDVPNPIELRDAPMPVAGPTQALVKVHAAGLNRGEFIKGHGLHGSQGAKAIGMEAAGEIVAVGDKVNSMSSFKVGDRVMARCGASFSEYALMNVQEMMAVPDSLSWEQAASIPITFLVTYDLLVQQGKLKSNDWLLINGVSSGVGVASLQMGKVLGAKVIGTSGSQTKLNQLKPLGLDLGICSRSADFYATVMSTTEGKGVQLVVNTVGGSVFEESFKCLSFQGRLGTVGYVDGVLHAPLDIEALHAKRLTLFGVSNKIRSPDQRAEPVQGFIKDILPAFAEGKIHACIDSVFEFKDLEGAKARMESNSHVGKIVLKVIS
jgi:NADPH:quinone reductase-like Zn-dependent oxidoreductase